MICPYCSKLAEDNSKEYGADYFICDDEYHIFIALKQKPHESLQYNLSIYNPRRFVPNAKCCIIGYDIAGYYLSINYGTCCEIPAFKLEDTYKVLKKCLELKVFL